MLVIEESGLRSPRDGFLESGNQLRFPDGMGEGAVSFEVIGVVSVSVIAGKDLTLWRVVESVSP
jgi:hypothetical protein